ncbi:MAG: chloride channel protein [Aurantimonas endophytica]|uniref:chloride channel protein n=1 Tax=Aurantimonas endophytica TaxID=1522175 RepID=UPI003002A58D
MSWDASRAGRAWRFLKASIQRRAVLLVPIAALIGIVAGAVVAGMTFATRELHRLLFVVPEGERLSAQAALLDPRMALVPALGGILIGLSIFFARRFRARPPVDPIEANALHGGRMSFRESVILAAQTMVSNGFGASVGLEAGYTQISAAVASWAGRVLELRRGDVRILVASGAAGAVAAAFDAPLTGAFYAFELILGTYTIAAVAPMMAAALAATLTADWLGAVQFSITIGAVEALEAADYVPFLLLGLVGGGVAILLMRLVTLVDSLFNKTGLRTEFRPLLGGLGVGALALVTPQVLSSGNGALYFDLTRDPALGMIFGVLVLKIMAAAISLGSGFRGGLFFASLFVGGLLGTLFAALVAFVAPSVAAGPIETALVGMTAVATGVVGGPLTMTFLALEVSGDLALAGGVLAAAIVASVLVRETFGYSFSTWRLHLRGETIRSAQDVGWIRSLTVASMMRTDVKTVPVNTTIAELKEAFPLGSTSRVVAVDEEGKYAGILLLAEAYGEREEPEADSRTDIGGLLKFSDEWLSPAMNARTAAGSFQRAKAEELAVLDRENQVVGLLTEGYLLRRYAEELEKVRRDLSGER